MSHRAALPASFEPDFFNTIDSERALGISESGPEASWALNGKFRRQSQGQFATLSRPVGPHSTKRVEDPRARSRSADVAVARSLPEPVLDLNNEALCRPPAGVARGKLPEIRHCRPLPFTQVWQSLRVKLDGAREVE